MEDTDPRWPRVREILASLEAKENFAKTYRFQDLQTDVSWDETVRRMTERVKAFNKSRPGPKWLDRYSGESADQLLSLEGQYRTDSLVLAFEEAIRQKANRDGPQSLTIEEQTVLTIEALEREVNNGGYDQFFRNSSLEFSPMVADSLKRIGCRKTASITERAIEALNLSNLTVESIEAGMAVEDENRTKTLRQCDDAYYAAAEPIAERLFAFIKANKGSYML